MENKVLASLTQSELDEREAEVYHQPVQDPDLLNYLSRANQTETRGSCRAVQIFDQKVSHTRKRRQEHI